MEDLNQAIREHEKEEALRAVQTVRDQQLGDVFALWFALACERHHDVIKTSLGGVFDLTATEETVKRTMAYVEGVLQQARAIHKKVSDALHLLDQRAVEVENRIAKAEAYLERLDRRLKPVSNGRKQ